VARAYARATLNSLTKELEYAILGLEIPETQKPAGVKPGIKPSDYEKALCHFLRVGDGTAIARAIFRSFQGVDGTSERAHREL